MARAYICWLRVTKHSGKGLSHQEVELKFSIPSNLANIGPIIYIYIWNRPINFYKSSFFLRKSYIMDKN